MSLKESTPIGHDAAEKLPGIKNYVDRFAAIHGVTPNPKRTFVFPYALAFEDMRGTTNVFAVDHDPKYPGYSTRPASAPEYLFRGMLFHHREIVKLDDSGREFFTEAVPTTRVLNDTVEAFGLTPGVDAFRFVQHPGKGVFPLGEWVRSLAAMQIPQADINAEPRYFEYFSLRPNKIYIPEWEMAQHDLTPSNHVNQWIVTSHAPTIRDALVGSARGLVNKYGLWHSGELDKTPAHDDVANFSEAADRLDILMADIYPAVAQVDMTDGDPRMQLGNIDDIVKRGFRVGTSVYPYRYVLNAFGLVPEDASDALTHQTMTAIQAEYAAATAKLFRKLETIRPCLDDTEGQREARMEAWETIIDRYATDDQKSAA